MIQRILRTALWPEENEPQSEWKKSIQEKEGDILCIPEFTFHGQQEDRATPNPEISDLAKAQHRYKSFMKKLSNTYRAELVKNDVFEAMMAVPLNGDAPIGISYDSTDSVVTIKIVTQRVNEKMARKTDGNCSGINLPA
ncbi:D-tyrosyl-tRNA(Tyr) deacylase [Aspergillus melleus]|uniref:D-tyrosyl-tRNA(Tyr) deacylase n=1 Tax=Aspergillus melleus TaxID=138277 RepID=UPI001E8CA376|nr:D-tyrosyl-tRNA(Tyr) deacylase [Aspergillus melleus]KAH8426422.1 D-tyrosyl-tRNA(Tyr) deacylase [Aspergillus melleus]